MTPQSSGRAPLVWTRKRAITALRTHLARLSGGEQSTCQVASERGIFCRGFRQWDDHEFHRRWTPVLGESTHLSRAQLERLADLWQTTEQVARHVRVACDMRTSAPGPCRGWEEFSDESLARFCGELLDRPVVVVCANDANESNPPGGLRRMKVTDKLSDEEVSS